jgi:hypothetical protein
VGWNKDLMKRIKFSIEHWNKTGQLSADDAEGFRISCETVAAKFGLASPA